MTEGDPKDNKHMDEHKQTSAIQDPIRSDLQPVKEAEPTEPEPKSEADQLADALNAASSNRDRWMRAVADLENYKKRAIHEKSNLLKYKNEELLKDLLPITDNLQRAIEHAAKNHPNDPMVEGVKMVLGMFRDLLNKYGVHEIEALGNMFDPHFHEALGRIPDPTQPANTVVQEYEKGYMYQDKLLRPSKVMVSVPE